MAANPQVTAKILDGAVIVQMLSPINSQTFEDYSKTVFMPYIDQQLEHTDRIDIVWDVGCPRQPESGDQRKQR